MTPATLACHEWVRRASDDCLRAYVHDGEGSPAHREACARYRSAAIMLASFEVLEGSE